MDTAGGDAMGAGVETGPPTESGGGARSGGGRLRESGRGRAERRASDADRRRKHGPKPPHAACVLRRPIER